jgi:sugar phosphate isomerase/epimerase
MIEEYFDVCGDYCGTVQIKDYYLEDRFVVHISETIPGTGMLDIDTVLRRTEALGPGMYAVVEHLPVGQIGLAVAHLAKRAAALGIEVH